MLEDVDMSRARYVALAEFVRRNRLPKELVRPLRSALQAAPSTPVGIAIMSISGKVFVREDLSTEALFGGRPVACVKTPRGRVVCGVATSAVIEPVLTGHGATEAATTPSTQADS